MSNVYQLDERRAAVAVTPPQLAPATAAHFHITAYRPEGKKEIGPIRDRRNVDRIANNYLIAHPDGRVFVKVCERADCR